MSIVMQPYSATALKALLLADPLSQGFAAMIAANNVPGIQEALNAPGAGIVPAPALTATDFVKLVISTPDELDAVPSLKYDQLNFILQHVGNMPIGDAVFQAFLARIWPANLAPNTNAAIVAGGVKKFASTAEQAFGANFSVNGDQIGDAIALM